MREIRFGCDSHKNSYPCPGRFAYKLQIVFFRAGMALAAWNVFSGLSPEFVNNVKLALTVGKVTIVYKFVHGHSLFFCKRNLSFRVQRCEL